MASSSNIALHSKNEDLNIVYLTATKICGTAYEYIFEDTMVFIPMANMFFDNYTDLDFPVTENTPPYFKIPNVLASKEIDINIETSFSSPYGSSSQIQGYGIMVNTGSRYLMVGYGYSAADTGSQSSGDIYKYRHSTAHFSVSGFNIQDKPAYLCIILNALGSCYTSLFTSYGSSMFMNFKSVAKISW